MADFGESGEILKVLYATLGRRATKSLVWAGTFVLILFLAQWGIQGVDWLMDRFAWASVSWSNLLYAFASTLLAMLMMVALVGAGALVIAIILHFGIDALQRRKVERITDSLISLLEESKEIVPQEQIPRVLSFISQAGEIRKSPLFVRVLYSLFKQKRKRDG